jgi:hypothetical protein
MRKILIALLIVIVMMSILWVFIGRQLSLVAEHFGTVETTSTPIKSLVYEKGGAYGGFIINTVHVDLGPADPDAAAPNVGTTKDNQFAVSFNGKVFAFGPLTSASDTDQLATAPQPGDEATIETRRSIFSWIIPPDFKTGRSVMWIRHLYYVLLWKKQDGAKLEMTWRYEQPFIPEKGWPPDETLSPIYPVGLIRIDISNAVR